MATSILIPSSFQNSSSISILPPSSISSSPQLVALDHSSLPSIPARRLRATPRLSPSLIIHLHTSRHRSQLSTLHSLLKRAPPTIDDQQAAASKIRKMEGSSSWGF
ncbi:unnamed protein product [Linum trigynum]|uniref:Uncharacterized protein n=1 Tax=Linum trigynum TaxID=586398 RepID=A0AAV2CJH9_9ROSI